MITLPRQTGGRARQVDGLALLLLLPPEPPLLLLPPLLDEEPIDAAKLPPELEPLGDPELEPEPPDPLPPEQGKPNTMAGAEPQAVSRRVSWNRTTSS